MPRAPRQQEEKRLQKEIEERDAKRNARVIPDVRHLTSAKLPHLRMSVSALRLTLLRSPLSPTRSPTTRAA